MFAVQAKSVTREKSDVKIRGNRFKMKRKLSYEKISPNRRTQLKNG